MVDSQEAPSLVWASGRGLLAATLGDYGDVVPIPEQPVIEKIRTHLALDAQPRPEGRTREAGHDLAA